MLRRVGVSKEEASHSSCSDDFKAALKSKLAEKDCLSENKDFFGMIVNAPQNVGEFCSDKFSNCSNDRDISPSSFRRRSLVRFAHKSQVQTTTNRDDYIAKEVNACCYSCEEKSLMYESDEKTVVRMEAGKRPKKNTTYRGLENFSEANSSQLDIIVHACINTVMDEQERQWKEDIFDWDRFREMSLEVSQQSISLAYKMAKYDEREARKAYIAMAKEEYERKQQEDLRRDDSSVSAEITEVTDSTMAQDIKSKHHKIQPVAPSQRLRLSSSSSPEWILKDTIKGEHSACVNVSADE